MTVFDSNKATEAEKLLREVYEQMTGRPALRVQDRDNKGQPTGKIRELYVVQLPAAFRYRIEDLFDWRDPQAGVGGPK